MLNRLISRDYPGSWLLTAMVVGLLAAMVLSPFLGASPPVLNLFVNIAIFTVLVGSFDLMLGYTGIISFAHTMFYGIGAYGVALALRDYGPGWLPIAVGLIGATLLAVALSLLIGLFSLRVRAIFFAMVTMA